MGHRFLKKIQHKWQNFASTPPSELRYRADSWVVVFIICFALVFLAIFGRLFYLASQHKDVNSHFISSINHAGARPDLLDRNGQLLAKDIRIYSLYAEPKNILDAQEAVELLSTVLPNLDPEDTYKKLTKKAGFVWIERGITPKQKAQIIALGLPGLSFMTETKRFYPQGRLASHILGYVDIDNHGLAGIERYIDDAGLRDLRAAGLNATHSLAPLRLSLDLRVQNAMREVVAQAIESYQALAGGAVLLNIKTGEILGMVSLPDFDPNNPVEALQSDRLNRITGAAYEMGSSIKGITTALALDSGKFTLDSLVDASKPLKVGRHMAIHDYYGKNRMLHLWEVFVYSSNIGSAQEVLAVGVDAHKAFLKRVGLLDRMNIELPEVARPVLPSPWRKVNSMTISFGHGLMTTPLQLAVATGAILNNGEKINPTFLKRKNTQPPLVGERVISPEISREMRYLFRLNGLIGSGRYAKVAGYRVGGKTGTAEKVENGKYVKNKKFNSFLAAFPMDNPQYILCTIIDEPKAEKGQRVSTAAMNAAPMAKEIIKRTELFLNIMPDFGKDSFSEVAKHFPTKKVNQP